MARADCDWSAGLAFARRIQEPGIREIFRYWLERRPPDGVPDWPSIDRKTIPHTCLPNLFLYEYEPEGRFRCKLIGTDLTRIFGRDETGRYLDAILDGAAAALELFKQTVTSGHPVYYRYRATEARGVASMFSRILLPVSSGHGKIDQIFGMVRYGPADHRRRPMEARSAENHLSAVIAATDDDLTPEAPRQNSSRAALR